MKGCIVAKIRFILGKLVLSDLYFKIGPIKNKIMLQQIVTYQDYCTLVQHAVLYTSKLESFSFEIN